MTAIHGDDLVRLAAEHHVVPSILTKRFAFAVAELAAAAEREAVAAEVALALKVGMPHDMLLEAIRKRGVL